MKHRWSQLPGKFLEMNYCYFTVKMFSITTFLITWSLRLEVDEEATIDDMVKYESLRGLNFNCNILVVRVYKNYFNFIINTYIPRSTIIRLLWNYSFLKSGSKSIMNWRFQGFIKHNYRSTIFTNNYSVVLLRPSDRCSF